MRKKTIGTMPILRFRNFNQEWTKALLESPFKDNFAKKYGNIMFLNAEIDLKTFSPEIIPMMQEVK